MKILIYGLNFSPELTGIGKYTGEMADWLSERGHEVQVITSPPYYPSWKIGRGYSKWKYFKEKFNNNVSVVRCPLWVPETPKTITRMIHLLSFTLSGAPILLKALFFWRPAIAICIAPSFFYAPQAALLCKIAGVENWLHFQDFEICSMFGAGMVKGQGINNIAHHLQSFITRRFNTISTISKTMCASAEKRNVSNKNIVLFPNWVDVDFMTPEADRSYFRRKWGINDKTKVILYSGNLGKKQGLENIVHSAYTLRQRKDILFLIVGDGVEKNALINQCKEYEGLNIQFHPLQPYELLPELLCMADIHLVIQKSGVADAVFPSKFTNILAVGGYSIITAAPNTELGQLVLQNPNMASLIEPDNSQLLTSTIRDLSNNGSVIRQFNKYARKYAVENLSKERILARFEENLKYNCKKK